MKNPGQRCVIIKLDVTYVLVLTYLLKKKGNITPDSDQQLSGKLQSRIQLTFCHTIDYDVFYNYFRSETIEKAHESGGVRIGSDAQ